MKPVTLALPRFEAVVNCDFTLWRGCLFLLVADENQADTLYEQWPEIRAWLIEQDAEIDGCFVQDKCGEPLYVLPMAESWDWPDSYPFDCGEGMSLFEAIAYSRFSPFLTQIFIPFTDEDDHEDCPMIYSNLQPDGTVSPKWHPDPYEVPIYNQRCFHDQEWDWRGTRYGLLQWVQLSHYFMNPRKLPSIPT